MNSIRVAQLFETCRALMLRNDMKYSIGQKIIEIQQHVSPTKFRIVGGFDSVKSLYSFLIGWEKGKEKYE